MALPQVKFREIIFQLLYSFDTGRTEEQGSIALLMKELKVTRSKVYEALNRTCLIQKHLPEIDTIIRNTVHGYSFERIQSVERNILRLAVFELTIEKEIPPKVTITEAMRLARKFSTPESSNFINAILDNIYKAMLGETQEPESIEETAQALVALEQLAEKCTEEGCE
jgi:transcription antitermination protein NusB